MTILNPDGTPYTVTGSIQSFDASNPDITYYQSVLQEYYRLWGSPVLYYEVIVQVENVDSLYLEDRSKLFSPIPVELFSIYEPTSSSKFMTSFGADAGTQDTLFRFAYHDVIAKLGHEPRMGSRLYTPHLGENWIVVNTQNQDFHMWNQFEILMLCSKWQNNATDSSGTPASSAKTITNYNINANFQ